MSLIFLSGNYGEVFNPQNPFIPYYFTVFPNISVLNLWGKTKYLWGIYKSFFGMRPPFLCANIRNFSFPPNKTYEKKRNVAKNNKRPRKETIFSKAFEFDA